MHCSDNEHEVVKHIMYTFIKMDFHVCTCIHVAINVSAASVFSLQGTSFRGQATSTKIKPTKICTVEELLTAIMALATLTHENISHENLSS